MFKRLLIVLALGAAIAACSPSGSSSSPDVANPSVSVPSEAVPSMTTESAAPS